MKKLLINFIFCIVFAVCAKEESGSFEQFKFPEFDSKTGQLKFIVYGNKANTLDEFILMEEVLLDFVKKEIKDISTIEEYKNRDIYPLNTKENIIQKFWKSKKHTKQFIKAAVANYDKSTKFIKGKKKIEFRSPNIDIDGVGFDMASSDKILNIYKDVKVHLRSSQIDTITKEISYSTTKVFSDELNANYSNNIITFSKNVVVIDKDSTIQCDKMVLFLKDNEVEKAICTTNVIITKQLKDDKQVATAQTAKYNLKNGKIELITNPKIVTKNNFLKGKTIILYSGKDQIEVNDDAYLKTVRETATSVITSDLMTSDMQKNVADFKGNVKFEDENNLLTCNYIITTFIDGKDDKKEVDTINCFGDVIIIKKNKGKLSLSDKTIANKAIYKLKDKKITLFGKPEIYRDGNNIKGDKIIIHEDSDRILVYDNVYLKLKKLGDSDLSKTDIFANFADLNMNNNISIFNKNVRVFDKVNGNLTCEKLVLNFKEVLQNNKKDKVLDTINAWTDIIIIRKDLPNSKYKNEIVKCQKMDLFYKQVNNRNKISKAELFKNVSIKREPININENQENYNAEIFEYDAEKNRITLTENATVQQGTELAMGEKITIFRKNKTLEKMRLEENAKIEFVNANEKTIITADYINIDNSKNKITCNDNVQSVDSLRTINCETMFIYTKKSIKTKKQEVEKIVCLENVLIKRKIENNQTQNSKSGKADYDVSTGEIVLTDNPILYKGRETMRGIKMIMHKDSQEVKIIGKVSGKLKYK